MTSSEAGRGLPDQGGQVARALSVLEVVAEQASSTAHGISQVTATQLTTVHRIAQELIRSEDLVQACASRAGRAHRPGVRTH